MIIESCTHLHITSEASHLSWCMFRQWTLEERTASEGAVVAWRGLIGLMFFSSAPFLDSRFDPHHPSLFLALVTLYEAFCSKSGSRKRLPTQKKIFHICERTHQFTKERMKGSRVVKIVQSRRYLWNPNNQVRCYTSVSRNLKTSRCWIVNDAHIYFTIITFC